MNKILTIEQAINISSKLRDKGKTIVVVGGCFDILHLGHVEFLQAAKKQGDVLLVLLESDQTIKKLKGESRPINSQEDRAKVLASLSAVDYVVNLPVISSDKAYDDLIISLKPTIIATTKGDHKRHHKERQAKTLNGKVVDVAKHLSKKSTSELSKLILEDYYL